MFRKSLAVLALAPFLVACETLQLNEPQSIGEVNSGFSYIPLDPLPVEAASLENCRPRGGAGKTPDAMDAFPNIATRIAVRQVTGSASGTFGPVAIGTSGNRYEVVLDFINYDMTTVRFAVAEVSSGAPRSVYDLPPLQVDNRGRPMPRPQYQFRAVRLDDEESAEEQEEIRGYDEVPIPVYVGVGLRLTAMVDVRRGTVNLASLPAIGAAAEANRTSGWLVLQTLGISGQPAGSNVGLMADLTPTTIQNAVVNLGAVKATLFDPTTLTVPQVTGIYNPLPTDDPRLINRIVSELSRWAPSWRPCSTFVIPSG